MLTSNHRTLLIVEDDARFRYLAGEAARKTEAFQQVIVVGDGQEAIDLISARIRQHEQPPGFVLTDLCMPRVDGIELLRHIKARRETRDIPVAVMTSSDRPNDREHATAAGCCAFFNKPERLDDLVLLIASIPQICGDDAPTSAHATTSRP